MKKETRQQKAARLIAENSTYGAFGSKLALLQKMYIGYLTGLSPQAITFIRQTAFTRTDESGEPENDIYCMESFPEDIESGHIEVPEHLQEEINRLIQFCEAEKLIWIGIY